MKTLSVFAVGLLFAGLCAIALSAQSDVDVAPADETVAFATDVAPVPAPTPVATPVLWRTRYALFPRAYSRKYPYRIPYCCPATPIKQTIPVVFAEETTDSDAEPAEPTEPAKYSNHPTIKAMLDECNKLRQANGRPPVVLDEHLCVAAQKYAELCAQTNGAGHFVGGSSPSARAVAAGYPNGSVGEIWASSFSSISSAFNAWMRSRGHRNILLGRYTQVGFGYSVDKGGNPHSYVGLFGNP